MALPGTVPPRPRGASCTELEGIGAHTARPQHRAAPPRAVLGVPRVPSRGVPGPGTHGPAAATLCLGVFGQLGGAAPVLAQQGLHAVDDVPDAVDEAVLLRLEDELVVDLEMGRRGGCSAPAATVPPPTTPTSPILTMTAAISSGLSPSRSNLKVTILLL